jgi:hypothetical protein
MKAPRLPILRAYLDETGDRGFSLGSSPLFGFCVVLVPDEHDPLLRQVIQGLRKDFGIANSDAVHWVEHLRLRNHDRRRHAAKQLAAVPDVRLIFALIDKPNVPANSGMRGDIVKTYNYASRLLFERMALTAQAWPGGARRVITKVSHVRGHDHAVSHDYITKTCPTSQSFVTVPWSLVTRNIQVAGAAAYDGLQAADLYAGMLNAAISPDKYGNTSPEHLQAVAHQLRRGPNGKVLDYGIKILGDKTIVTGQDWWPSIES